MSDIPDWLVELASQGSDDDQEVEESDDPLAFLSSEAPVYEPEPQSEEPPYEVTPAVEAEDDADLMTALREQVEVDELDDAFEPAESKRRFNLRLPGLLPWQQFVLALLLFLDVVAIGLLFLVMLGRISIG